MSPYVNLGHFRSVIARSPGDEAIQGKRESGQKKNTIILAPQWIS